MIKKLTACILLTVMVMSSVAFAAASADHWFAGIAPEAAKFYPRVEKDEFNPDDYITMEEFASVATNAIGRPVAYSTDRSEDFVTRYDALVIICERMNYKYNLTEEEELTAALTIAEFNDMPQEYKQTALLSVKKGLIKGDENGNLNLDDYATKAELLTIFVRTKQK